MIFILLSPTKNFNSYFDLNFIQIFNAYFEDIFSSLLYFEIGFRNRYQILLPFQEYFLKFKNKIATDLVLQATQRWPMNPALAGLLATNDIYFIKSYKKNF